MEAREEGTEEGMWILETQRSDSWGSTGLHTDRWERWMFLVYCLIQAELAEGNSQSFLETVEEEVQ